MAASFPLLETRYWCSSTLMKRRPKHLSSCKADQLKSRNPLDVDFPGILYGRRPAILSSGASLVSFLAISYGLTPSRIKAEEKRVNETENEGEDGVLGSIKSLFDPNEKTKSGKLLPKGYLKTAREVVKTLRDSLEEDTNDTAKFRRTADAAKESIREYLNSWRGQKEVIGEESYVALEKAIRSLASFYSKAGPSAKLSEDVKRRILDELSTAEAYL